MRRIEIGLKCLLPTIKQVGRNNDALESVDFKSILDLRIDKVFFLYWFCRENKLP